MIYVPALGGANKGNRELLEALAATNHHCLAVVPAISPHGPRTRGEFLKDLTCRGIKVIASSTEVDVFRLNGVEIHALADPKRMADYLRELVGAQKPTWVVVGVDDPGQVLVDAALDVCPGRVILLVRTTFYLPFGPVSIFSSREKIERITRAAVILCNSRHVADYVEKHLGGAIGRRPRIVSMPLPVMTLGPGPFPRTGCFDRGFVTMINPCAVKGIAIFLELARKFPRVAFAAVPTWGTTGADRNALGQFSNIHLLEPDENIQSILGQTRVLLVPSLWDEAFGRIVVEAMLQGVPVLASDVGGLPEAKLGVDYVLPVRPICSYEPRVDEHHLPIPLVPPQDTGPWEAALHELLGARTRYEELSAASREAAMKFVSGVSAADFERFLCGLVPEERFSVDATIEPAARENAEKNRQERLQALSPDKRTLLAMKALEARRKRPDLANSEDRIRTDRRPGQDRFPASFAQERFLFLSQLEPDSAAYHIPQVIRLGGPLNLSALQQSLDAIVARHEALRTNIVAGGVTAEQIIADPRAIDLVVVDLSDRSGSDQALELERLITRQTCRKFDLAKDLLLRASLARLGPQEQILVLTQHHIAGDAWSVRILLRELETLYEAACAGRVLSLPELRLQYADFAVWQRQRIQGDFLHGQLDFWKRQLVGLPDLLDLPTDRPRSARATSQAGRESLVLSPGVIEGLDELGRREGVTRFMMFLAAFQILLHRHTGEADIAVGCPVTGRNRSDLEDIIGCFVNTLVFRSVLQDNPTVGGFLARMRKTALDVHAHQDLPFEQLVEALHPERAVSHTPLVQVVFALENTPLRPGEHAGLVFDPRPSYPPHAKFDLALFIRAREGGLDCEIEYKTELFQSATIVRMLKHFQRLLEAFVTDPEQPVSRLSLLTPAERHQVLVEWNSTGADFPRDRMIHELFESQAERSPEAVAVVFGQRQISYGELDRRASQLAACLRDRGVGPESLVAICIDRSLEMMVALLGILKAGGAYVPLDIAHPKERLAFTLRDAQPVVLVTEQRFREMLPPHQIDVVCLDALPPARQRDEVDRPETDSSQLAYVLYTSGSTGQPKGVQITHRAVVNFLTSMRRQPGLGPEDVMLAVTTLTFDIAGLELFLPLTTGARVVIASRAVATDGKQLARLLDESGATVMQGTPATWQLLLQAGWAGNPRLKILCGGETLPVDLARKLLERGQAVWNLYGPTETTVWSAAARIEPDRPIVLGGPIANTQFYILDRGLEPRPVGLPGELFIGGEGLARGYLRRPELTAERFVSCPFDAQNGARMYRTGDRARYLPDGSVEFLGRLDQQVKLRGYRIELGEIEAVLRQHPSVGEVVVMIREDVPGDQRLVACVEPQPRGSLVTTDLRHHLRIKLPEYMIPSSFVIMKKLPLNSNGKPDRKALVEKKVLIEAPEAQFAGPRNKLEQRLARLWESIIRNQRIGIHDNFFELGGHSLLALRMLTRIKQEIRVDVSLAALFRAPTIAELAEEISKGERKDAWSSLVPIRSGGSKEPLFLVHAHSGEVLGYVPLVRRLSKEWPVFGIQSQALSGDRMEDDRIEDIAARYVREIKLLQSEGPYHLGGFCLGGILAYEMACQLRAGGDTVAYLGMIQAATPDAIRPFATTGPLQRLLYRLATRMHYELNIFFGLTWREAILRFGDRLRRFGELVQWKTEMLWKSRTQPGRSNHSNRSIALTRALLNKTYRKALRNYQPRPYDGSLTLFRARTQPWGCEVHPTLGWSKLVRGRISLFVVPGHHNILLSEPNLQVLASRLEASLESSRAAPLTFALPSADGGIR